MLEKRIFYKLEQKHKKLVNKYIEDEIINDPYKHSKRLKEGNLRGIRSRRIGNYRLIFIVCEECRQIGYNAELKCPDCEEFDDKIVKLILYDYRDKIYDKLERMLQMK